MKKKRMSSNQEKFHEKTIYGAIFRRDIKCLKHILKVDKDSIQKNVPRSEMEITLLLLSFNIEIPFTYILSGTMEKPNQDTLTFMKFLVLNKGDVNVETPKKERLLKKAVENKNFDIVKFLVENNADVTANQNEALFASTKQVCRGEKCTIAKFLLENKADITVADNAIVRKAVFAEDFNFLNFLIENKADINSEQGSALRIAIQMDNFNMVKFLVENKADVNINDNMPIRTATEYGIQCVADEKMVDYLLSKGCKPPPEIIDEKLKMIILRRKYFRKWRKVVFRNFIRKVIVPLYYSPLFLVGCVNKGFKKDFLLI